MPTSQNGWSASPNLHVRPLVVDGVGFLPGIRDDDDVAYVLGYFAEQFAKRVQPLKNPGCWGFSYRADKNQASDLSNHASGTAIDLNAPAHPNGVATAKTFTAAQVSAVHQILAECHGALRWGGDYTHTVDAMHVEVNVSPARLKEVATLMKADAYQTAKPKRPTGIQDTIDAAKKAKKAAKKNPVRKGKLKTILATLRGIGGKK